MWEAYREIVRCSARAPLSEERRLILEAQNGSKKSKNELVLRHVGFLIFRIHKRVFPSLVRKKPLT